MSRLAQIAAVRAPYVQGLRHGARILTAEPPRTTRLECSVCGVQWDVRPGQLREDYLEDGAIVCTFDRQRWCEACCDWRRGPHECE